MKLGGEKELGELGFTLCPVDTPGPSKSRVYWWKDNSNNQYYCRGGGLVGIGDTLEDAINNYLQDFYY